MMKNYHENEVDSFKTVNLEAKQQLISDQRSGKRLFIEEFRIINFRGG